MFTVKTRLRSLLVAALALPLLAAAAGAEAAVCDRLNARLASLPRVTGDPAAARKYAGAIAQQNIQLRKAKSDRRRLGCGSASVTVVGGPNAESCRAVLTAIDKMERNLQILEKKRREFASAGGDSGARRRIEQALAANGCDADDSRVMPVTATGKFKVLDIERPSAVASEPLHDGRSALSLRPLGDMPRSGGLRTVCVRTCDGGFFPISSGATPLDFRRDQKICAAMCPNTETELFYHSIASQETDQMVSSLTGQPYSVLPNAFAYRTRDLSKPDRCGCNLSAYYKAMIRREAAAEGGEPPEQTGSITTITTTAGEKEPPAAERKVIERPWHPDKDKVRIVGPVFLPTEESAIDLRHPLGGDYN
ncbi:DUF2865 domain-containing protein [Rhizobium sp. TRM95111]|uniref:DUF2865 domain-containing protein n=1 Tax=Rhizobium alarense TaxID=2846851 RepID=UPI001F48F23B|nr:DUF2865 domain-containing protein [Rhizobium alarense]MCF3641936.1 DUF2865 domain-containing protein [Rhizobium alarense]